MKLTFIGSGSAFTVGDHNYHSNMILQQNKSRLLIDCGSDARLALAELGLKYSDIDSVYISHLHADHIGGLEWLGFTTLFDPRCKKPNLYISHHMATDLWSKSLSGGLGSIQGQIVDIHNYFNVKLLQENSGFIWKHVRFKIIQTIHVMSGFALLPSYGLMFTANGKKIFITTDTQFAPTQIMDFYKLADIIFHDCETTPQKSGVHAHYSELKTLAPELKAKMWLYHYNPGRLPDARKDGFRGFVKKGQCFDFEKPETLK